jgi:tetratricopeptide (TPR) repeat protein
MGMSKLGEKNPTGALVELTDAARIKPNDPEILFYLARAYHEKKTFLLAEQTYLRVLELKPDYSSARNDLGVTYLEMKRWDDAIRQFKIIVDDIFYQAHNEARLNLGLAYFGKGDYEHSLEEFRSLLSTSPRDPRPRYNMGRVFMAMGKTDQAEEEFRRALEIFPTYVPTRYHMGLALLKQGKNTQAGDEFREVVRLAPDSELGQLAKEQLRLLK